MTVPERTDHTQLDAALRRILTEPTHSARLLTETADRLEDESPFLVLTGWQYSDASIAAHKSVLHNLPAVIANEAIVRALTAQPVPRHGETAGEYALRLRAAAKGL
jgi:hypothetical protein